MSRTTGTIKWFNNDKGFGFVSFDDGARDAFVHFSEIQSEGFRTLEEGDTVEFDLAEEGRGPKAKNVVKISCVRSVVGWTGTGEGFRAFPGFLLPADYCSIAFTRSRSPSPGVGVRPRIVMITS